MIAGRSTILRCRTSSSILRWPSASIGTLSALAIEKCPSSQNLALTRPERLADTRTNCAIVSVYGSGIIGLKRRNFKRVAAHRLDRPGGGEARRGGREIGHLAVERGGADRMAVL